MAKSLVRNRHAVTKMYGLKSQLQAVSLRIAVSCSSPIMSIFACPGYAVGARTAQTSARIVTCAPHQHSCKQASRSTLLQSL